jgi:hypothetical protein
VHLVELHAQVGDTRARLLARFEIEQEAVAVVLDRAQLVEFGIEPGRDHAAVADERGGFFHDRARDQFAAAGRRRHLPRDVGKQGIRRRELARNACRLLQREAQADQFARAHLAQRDARRDALDIAAALEFVAQLAPRPFAQQSNRVMPLQRMRAIATRLQHPALEHPAAHAGHAGVEQREERG